MAHVRADALTSHLVAKNASQKHMLEPLPQLRVKLARAFGVGSYVRHWRTTIDLGSFEQLRNPDNFPGRLQGDAFPVYNSRDVVCGRVNEDVVGGYIVVKKGKGFSVAGLRREKIWENGE